MTRNALDTPAPDQLYAQIQQFYALHMGLLDDGAVDAWASFFTPDAVFEDNTTPEPLRGREAIRATVRTRVEHLRAERRQFRHWFGMVDVAVQPDGELHTRMYALAMSTVVGGPLRIHGHVVCRDRLIPRGGSWTVHNRRVEVDGV